MQAIRTPTASGPRRNETAAIPPTIPGVTPLEVEGAVEAVSTDAESPLILGKGAVGIRLEVNFSEVVEIKV